MQNQAISAMDVGVDFQITQVQSLLSMSLT